MEFFVASFMSKRRLRYFWYSSASSTDWISCLQPEWSTMYKWIPGRLVKLCSWEKKDKWNAITVCRTSVTSSHFLRPDCFLALLKCLECFQMSNITSFFLRFPNRKVMHVVQSIQLSIEEFQRESSDFSFCGLSCFLKWTIEALWGNVTPYGVCVMLLPQSLCVLSLIFSRAASPSDEPRFGSRTANWSWILTRETDISSSCLLTIINSFH